MALLSSFWLLVAFGAGGRLAALDVAHPSAHVAVGDFARLVDAHHHPDGLIAACAVPVAKLGDQDRSPSSVSSLISNRESGRRRRLGLLRGPCHLLVSLQDHLSL